MPVRTVIAAWLGLAPLALIPALAAAATIVIANRSGSTVQFAVTPQGGAASDVKLAASDLTSIAVDGPLSLDYRIGEKPHHFQLDPNSAYYFGSTDGQVTLRKIGLSERPTTVLAKDAKPPQPATYLTASGKIPVKIFVDEEEQATRQVWERRLKQRVEAASKIFEAHCHIGFEVVATGTWESDNRLTDFVRSLREFEQKADLGSARLAIGFTSQYHIPQGRTNLGGTHGALNMHILIREWSQQINEPERLEVLVHEMGHFLGAAHSPESDSVMRPVLGDRQARSRDFRIGFDPVNTLVMSLVGEEMRIRPIHSFGELSPGSRLLLFDIYTQLAVALPSDPTAAEYRQLVNPGAPPLVMRKP